MPGTDQSGTWRARAVGLLLAAALLSGRGAGICRADDRPPLGQELAEGISAAERSFVLIVSQPPGAGGPNRLPGRARRLVGCGVNLDPDGYVLTTSSVVENAREVTVVSASRGPLAGEVIGIDPLWDLAVIQIPGGTAPGIAVGNSDSLEIGNWVTMLAANYGSGPVASVGILTDRVRTSGPWGGEMLRVFAPIRPGDTGAVLLNERGEAVGIVSATLSGSPGIAGLVPTTQRSAALANYVEGVAIPINQAIAIAWQVIENGSIHRGFLGVRIQAVTRPLAEALDLDKGVGAYVVEVVAGGPADGAGVAPGDVILSVDGQAIRDVRELHRLVIETSPGETRELELLRAGERRRVPVQIGDSAGHLADLSADLESELTPGTPQEAVPARRTELVTEVEILKARLAELEKEIATLEH